MEFIKSKVKQLDWIDIGLIKWSCIAFGILLAMLFPEILNIDIWLIVAIIVILALRPTYRVYIKK